jgi:Holliday junction resolvasome RuvABC DNA-binding subunit
MQVSDNATTRLFVLWEKDELELSTPLINITGLGPIIALAFWEAFDPQRLYKAIAGQDQEKTHYNGARIR